MKVFLPIHVYRVAFQPVKGRPYSLFERSLLEAVDAGVSTPGQLVDLLCVHRSVVIQGMVTLMYAGWINFTPGGSVTYAITKLGRQALEDPDSLPASRQILQERSTKVIMERLWGSVCKLAELNFVQLGTLKKVHRTGKPYLVLPPEFWTDPEPNQVRRFISVAPDERILHVGPVTLDRDSDWAMLDVDVEAKSITGLPQAWAEELVLEADIFDKASDGAREYWRAMEPVDETEADAETLEKDDKDMGDAQEELAREMLVAAAGYSSDETFAERLNLDRTIQVNVSQQTRNFEDEDNSDRKDLWLQDLEFDPPAEYPVRADQIEFIVDGDSHEKYLNNRLGGRDEASSYAVIHSESMHAEVIERLFPALQNALMRGLNIDFLWGVEPMRSRISSHKTARV